MAALLTLTDLQNDPDAPLRNGERRRSCGRSGEHHVLAREDGETGKKGERRGGRREGKEEMTDGSRSPLGEKNCNGTFILRRKSK